MGGAVWEGLEGLSLAAGFEISKAHSQLNLLQLHAYLPATMLPDRTVMDFNLLEPWTPKLNAFFNKLSCS